MLEIKNLHASVDETPILSGLNLSVNPGEIHAIMGPNGAGKSTLAKILAGHPAYEVTRGEISFEGQDVLGLEPEERAKLGLFMSFQYPPEISGVSNRQFLEHALKHLPAEEFEKRLQTKLELVKMDPSFLKRSVNEGFSGGEKKRNEILQMALLEPKLAILDETDSGLDIDAMRVIAEGVNRLMSNERALILITHYQRLLDYIQPHYVHVLAGGKIVQSGGAELAHQLEAEGYQCWTS